MKRATARATDSEATPVYPSAVERVSEPELPLYAVLDRRESGEWRTLDTFADPLIAREVCALLKSFGTETRIELIPPPIVP